MAPDRKKHSRGAGLRDAQTGTGGTASRFSPLRARFPALAAVLFWLLEWQTGAALVNRRLLIPIPTPVSTAAALIRLCQDQSFFHAILLSLLRIAFGFAGALLIGTLLAVLCARFEPLHILFLPLLQLIRAIPVASFTILVFLWVARERIPSVISFLTVLPIIWANIENGLRSADAGLTEMARVFGMSGPQILKEILLPGIRPFFTSAVSSGIGFAWKSGVAAEVICRTQNSLGNLLWAGKSSVDYDEVFAVTLVIVLLCTALQAAAGRLLKKGRKPASAPLPESAAAESRTQKGGPAND